MDARPSVETAMSLWGLAATIALPGEGTLPAEPARALTVAWLPATTLVPPPGVEVGIVETRRRVLLRRTDVPDLRQGALLVAPELAGGPSQRWRVDVVDMAAPDCVTALVVPDKDPYP